MESIFKIICFFFLVSVKSFSQSCEFVDFEKNQIGYFLYDSQIRMILRDTVLPRNRSKTRNEKVLAVKKSIESVWQGNSVPSLNSTDLAELIVDVASSTGVDYQILASIVKKESNYCLNRFNTRGGDSGCMQFTSPALTELKHQFGFSGEGKYTPGMPGTLATLASRFLGTNSQFETKKFLSWLEADIPVIKNQLRRGSNFAYDILSGGIYLKLYLSIYNGSYPIAVRNYNGSKQKYSYEKKVISGATKISESELGDHVKICRESEIFADEVNRSACDLEDDYDECYRDYFRNSPGYL